MQKNQLSNSDLNISRIGLGTMTWGRETNEEDAFNQLNLYLNAGGSFLDTAADYGHGDSEILIGKIIKKSVKRNNIIIATKAGLSSSSGKRVINNSKINLLSDLDNSLKRLDVDYIDLWQVHSWEEKTPLEEILDALNYAVTSGRVRHIGVSNWGWHLIRAIIAQNPILGKHPIISTQNEFSLLNQSIKRDILPISNLTNIGVLAWSPLGRGVLTGKYQFKTPLDSRINSPHYSKFISPYLEKESSNIVNAIIDYSKICGYSPTELSIMWVRDTPGIASSIVGTRNVYQLNDILKTEKMFLSKEIRDTLDNISNRKKETI
jgi:aryl-alcohol dehydrogenase-like predicted oxidoreductase